MSQVRLTGEGPETPLANSRGFQYSSFRPCPRLFCSVFLKGFYAGGLETTRAAGAAGALIDCATASNN
eukprot:5322116-Pyramimonas_sp.AAC.1